MRAALRRVGEALEHRLAAAVLRPAGNDERAEAGLAGEIRIRVGGGVVTAARRLAHRRQRLRRRVPCSRPCAFMCVTTGTMPGRSPIAIVSAMPARELKFDSGVIRSWLVKLVRARPRHVDDLDHFLGLGEVSRLVVEPSRDAPGALVQAGGDHRAHALRSRRAPDAGRPCRPRPATRALKPM